MLNKQWVRIGVGLIVVGLLVLAAAPSLYLVSSADGVVNGRIGRFTSPIEGELRFNTTTRYGSFFKAGEVIGEVRNERVDRRLLHELVTEQRTLAARIAGLDAKLAEFAGLEGRLEGELERYRSFTTRQLESLIEQESHRLREEQAEHKRSLAEYESGLAVNRQGALPARELERLEAAHAQSTMRLERSQHRLEELGIVREALEAGIFLDAGSDDVPYSRQRMDQLAIELAHARASRDEARDRLPGIEAQLEAERARIEKAEAYRLVAPFDALVWRLPSPEGSTVAVGTELVVLLECGSIFLDLAVSESQFDTILPGDTLAYRLIGDDRTHEGTVVSLRGSGSVQGDTELAALLGGGGRKDFRVWVSVEPGDLELTPANFHQIGRRVEAKIQRRFRPGAWWNRFWDVF